MSNKEISVGETVWDIHNPIFTGTVTSISDSYIKVMTYKEELHYGAKTPLMLTNDPNKIIKRLLEKLSNSEESVQELRSNYWNVHQELIKLKNSLLKK